MERDGTRVVRPVEHLGSRTEAGARERAEDPVVCGQEEDAADIEEDRFGRGRKRPGHGPKTIGAPRTGWYR